MENGQRLLNEAELLEFEDPPSTKFFLSIIAQEECAKGFLLYLVSIGAVPWNSLILRASRDHNCKHLLCIVMDFLDPDDEEFISRMDSSILKHKRLDMPARVADSMNILRHEKIGRWESSKWVWAEDPNYEKEALEIAEGKLDRIKQRSLYVELTKTGDVKASPNQITKDQANVEYEKGRRFVFFLRDLAEGEPPISVDYENIEQSFRALFSKHIENA